MESQTIAALCKERGIANLALKAVSDGMDDDLSPILGGIDIIRNARVLLPPLQFIHHDQITRINFLNVGGGGAYALTDALTEKIGGRCSAASAQVSPPSPEAKSSPDSAPK